MQINRIILIITASVFLMASTCGKKEPECDEGSHNAFTFINKSSKRINFYIYWNYPDTMIGEYNPKGFGIIAPGASSSRGPGPRSCWEAYLKDGKKEYLYIFDEDSLQAIRWETVRATNRGLLERREISQQYLQVNDFIITYP